jgi:hypothetical protein
MTTNIPCATVTVAPMLPSPKVQRAGQFPIGIVLFVLSCFFSGRCGVRAPPSISIIRWWHGKSTAQNSAISGDGDRHTPATRAVAAWRWWARGLRPPGTQGLTSPLKGRHGATPAYSRIRLDLPTNLHAGSETKSRCI